MANIVKLKNLEGTVIYPQTKIEGVTFDDGSSVSDQITANTGARHTHSNKTFLDTVTGLKTVNGNSLIGTGNIEIEGGGAGAFIISCTPTEIMTSSSVSITTDKTYTEIAQAYNDGLVLICKYTTMGNLLLPLTAVYGEEYEFWFGFASLDDEDNTIFSNSIQIASSGSTFYYNDLAVPDVSAFITTDDPGTAVETNAINADTLDGHNASYFAKASDIPLNTSSLTNDSGFLTSYTETDPTVPSWAKQSSKPIYRATEVIYSDDYNVKQAIDLKASSSELTTALASKADVSALDSKADVSALEGKADVSALESKADVSALNAKAPIASPTFTGTAKVSSNTNYTTAQLRNIIISTADPTGGSSGDIWIKYTE